MTATAQLQSPVFVSNPIFGRKYKLEVSSPGAAPGTSDVITVTDSAFEPEALRITFDVYMVAMHGAYWYADIDIYNLDQTTTEKIVTASSTISQGMTVTLSAGYDNGNYDVIFVGPVFQPLWVRENVVDFKTTLHCILGLDEISRTNISGQYAANCNQTEIVLDIIKKAGLQADSISDKISDKKLPRGKSVFGSPGDLLTEVAEDNDMVWFLSQRGITMGRLDDNLASTDPSIVYTSTTGLIGTPEQTQQGVDFTVCLDPRLKIQLPLTSAKIDQSSIRFQKKQIGEYPSLLDRDGIYVIGGVRHRGDSRGELWQTEVTGYTKIGAALGITTGQANVIR